MFLKQNTVTQTLKNLAYYKIINVCEKTIFYFYHFICITEAEIVYKLQLIQKTYTSFNLNRHFVQGTTAVVLFIQVL